MTTAELIQLMMHLNSKKIYLNQVLKINFFQVLKPEKGEAFILYKNEMHKNLRKFEQKFNKYTSQRAKVSAQFLKTEEKKLLLVGKERS